MTKLQREKLTRLRTEAADPRTLSERPAHADMRMAVVACRQGSQASELLNLCCGSTLGA